jgi:signal transduction histidine kinase
MRPAPALGAGARGSRATSGRQCGGTFAHDAGAFRALHATDAIGPHAGHGPLVRASPTLIHRDRIDVSPPQTPPDGLAEHPEAGERFAIELRERMVARLQITCQLALLLVPLFFVLDLVVHPHILGTLLVIRLTMMLCFLFAIGATRTPIGQRYVTALSFFMVWQTGFGIVVMTALDGGASSGYYAGVNLVMLAAAVLLPWDTALSIAAAGALIGTYVIASVVWGGVPDATVFAENLFFLGSTALIMVVSHRATRRAHHHEFLQRVALEEAGRHRDAFLANITHELRTPLAAILGFTEMLVDYMDGATVEQRGWLARINENALTLYRLIIQLLDFSKIEAGALTLAREPVSLPTIVAKVADDMRAIAGEAHTQVETAVPDLMPAVLGDAGRVEEIVSNLAANALKFSRGRPIRLTLRIGMLHATPWQRIVPDPGPDARGRAYAEIHITDTGVGIRAEDLRRIFVAFLQLDGSSTRRHEGTGLGLAISARLAASMGGHIAVRSTPGQGSTFAFLLPIEDEHPAQHPADDEHLASLSA